MPSQVEKNKNWIELDYIENDDNQSERLLSRIKDMQQIPCETDCAILPCFVCCLSLGSVEIEICLKRMGVNDQDSEAANINLSTKSELFPLLRRIISKFLITMQTSYNTTSDLLFYCLTNNSYQLFHSTGVNAIVSHVREM